MIWLLFIALFILLGILSWEKIFPDRQIIETILFGSLFGMMLGCIVPFLFSLVVPFNNAAILSLTIAVIAATVIISLDWKKWDKKIKDVAAELKKPKRSFAILAIAFFLIAIPFMFLISRILFVDESGYFTTGFRSAYGDIPFHLMYINSFSHGNNFPPQNPDFGGTLSNYPFLPFFSSSAMLSLGADLIPAFLAPLFILGIIIIGLLLYVPWRITKKPWAAVLVPVIFLLSGGLGFLYFFHAHGFDIFSTVKMFSNVVVDEATNIPTNGINLMNVVISSLLPQRGVFFGLPIFLCIILLWFNPTKRSIIVSAILMSLLPLLHAHTFITLAVVLPFYLFYLYKTGGFKLWPWIWFGIINVCAIIPVLTFFHPNLNQSTGFIHLTFGWITGKTNIIWYWIKNLGFFLVLLATAFVPGVVPKKIKLWYLPFISIFFIANFVMFSPWDFDNHKLFNLWYLVSSFIVAYTLTIFFEYRSVFIKAVAAILLILIIISGAIDFARLFLFSQKGFGLFSPESQKLGVFLRNNTPADSLFLSSTSHISPVVLSGRKRFLGYTGWLWSRGIDFKERLADEKIMLAGTDKSDALLKEKGIDYVLIGNQEFNEFPVNTLFFEEHYEKVYNEDGYQLFSIN